MATKRGQRLLKIMWQKIILQSKKNLPDRGFLTLEVIVATLVAFFFLMFSLQALVLAMFMKVQAQEDQRADQLIQEDIERVGNLSSILTAGNCNATTYNDGYAQDLWDGLINVANTPQTHPDLLTASLLTPGAGGASGTTLSLYRTHVNINPTAPYRNLKIFYRVTNSDNDLIASRYLEIIPDEALQCP